MTAKLRLATPNGSTLRTDSPISVIIADDHETVRRNLRAVLDHEQGVAVIAEAADMETAIAHVTARIPQVLVLDLHLPGGSSLAAIRRLRHEAPSTEIVVLTMEESPAFAQHALDAGAVGFVIKDRADDELPIAVRRASHGEEYVSPRLEAKLEDLRAAVDQDRLTARETEVLRLIALGHTSAEIAAKLSLSRRTVETHRAKIFNKLGLNTRAQLVSYALGRHLIGN